jgi:hypothetical protein
MLLVAAASVIGAAQAVEVNLSAINLTLFRLSRYRQCDKIQRLELSRLCWVDLSIHPALNVIGGPYVSSSALYVDDDGKEQWCTQSCMSSAHLGSSC